MPSASTLAAFALAAYVLLVIPGPAVTFVVARSVENGREVGLASALGLHTGTMVWVAASATGLAALLMSWTLALSVIKYLGVAYLTYLGIRTLLASRGDRQRVQLSEEDAETGRATHPLRAFRQGVVVNVFNPKLGVFFLAFLPQFIDPAGGTVTSQLAVLGALFVVLGILSDGTYALAASAISARLRRNTRITQRLGQLSGLVYLALAAWAATVTPSHATEST